MKHNLLLRYPVNDKKCEKGVKKAHRAVYHYSDVIMSTMVSQITSLTIVYSTVYSDADQRIHQSSTSLAFVWGINRWPVNSPAQMASNAKKSFHLMTSSCKSKMVIAWLDRRYVRVHFYQLYMNKPVRQAQFSTERSYQCKDLTGRNDDLNLSQIVLC